MSHHVLRGGPCSARVVYFLVDPLTARALINTPKIDRDSDNPASTTTFSYVIANDYVAHFTVLLLAFLGISVLHHSRSQRLYDLTLFAYVRTRYMLISLD